MNNGIIIPGQTVWAEFTTTTATGAAADADSLPTGTVSNNGTDDGAVTVTVTDKGVGVYKASFAVPTTYRYADQVKLHVAATIGGVATAEYKGEWTVGLGFRGTAQAGGSTSALKGASTDPGTAANCKGKTLVLVHATDPPFRTGIVSYTPATKVYVPLTTLPWTPDGLVYTFLDEPWPELGTGSDYPALSVGGLVTAINPAAVSDIITGAPIATDGDGNVSLSSASRTLIAQVIAALSDAGYLSGTVAGDVKRAARPRR